jgi:predicted enzyme related to lactoylglutathione lyase
MLRSAPILHFSAVVDDLERTVAFYGDAFGFTPSLPPTDLGDAFARMVGVAGVSARLAQLVHPDRPETLEFVACTGQPGAASDAIPLAHVAFSVPDLDAALDAARAAGAEVLGEVVAFSEGRSTYCREPGGSVFELEELYA